MNEKTAGKLNELLVASTPIALRANHSVQQSEPNSLVALWPTLTAIVRKHEAEMIRLEIIAAATEKRRVDISNPCWDVYTAVKEYYAGSGIPWKPTKRQWDLARPEIDAAIAADNARRLSEYETYRIACAQGVAVPPHQCP